MCAHDAVAQKDFYPHLPDIPVEVDEDEETIKIVQLVKSNEPLVSYIVFIHDEMKEVYYMFPHNKTILFVILVFSQEDFKLHSIK